MSINFSSGEDRQTITLAPAAMVAMYSALYSSLPTGSIALLVSIGWITELAAQVREF